MITVTPEEGEGGGFGLDIDASGGIKDRSQLIALLLLTIEQLTGVSGEVYALQIDASRRGAGLPTLSELWD